MSNLIVEAVAPVKGKMSSYLRRMAAKGTIVVPVATTKAGPVKPMDSIEMAKVVPELVKGAYYLDENGIPQGWTNEAGVSSVVFFDTLGIGGLANAVYVSRPNIVWTRPMSAWVVANVPDHNRDSTKTGVERYLKAQNLPDSNPEAWKSVGNTLEFTCEKGHSSFDGKNVQKMGGTFNGKHSILTAFPKSNRSAIVVTLTFGTPEEFVRLKDRGILRTVKDEVNRLKRYQRFADEATLTEYLGIKPEAKLTPADCATLGKEHSEALHHLNVFKNGYKSFKDAREFGPTAAMLIDDEFGDLLQPILLDVFLLDREKTRETSGGTMKAGGLKLRCKLSHVAAAILACAAVKNEFGQWEVDSNIVDFYLTGVFDSDGNETDKAFFVQMLDEKNTDEDNPAVMLRNAMEAFKLNSMTLQHVRFTVLQACMSAALDIAETGDTEQEFDIDTLLSYVPELDEKGKKLPAFRFYFGTPLDTEKAVFKVLEGTASGDAEEFVADDDEE
ncbi:hypothetical protein UFOVP991_18 [uncultured Caudovirales phage]|uniref:Uncharacterized protein n=2 Tax=uncultured Caudovirales phage TaxID=2100421 RepID=A0A6J5QNT8_9CAUD|nr:hypothetical protein UFOVP991_18 [uncultured Caudovirales phage]CAB4182668.1 hypothetical protein UFOVP1076_18 [uncultured Caudovirales phage]CAB4211284.1 hypothetical protein UFOVP1427_9 [uncultured Caudovirales phage]CAB5237975.1 hypothetical protein UFOVP1523_13 [uncultured Caudovirales phage]